MGSVVATSADDDGLAALREIFGEGEWDDAALQWVLSYANQHEGGSAHSAAVELALSFGTAANLRDVLGEELPPALDG